MNVFYNDGTSIECGLQQGFHEAFNNPNAIYYQQNSIYDVYEFCEESGIMKEVINDPIFKDCVNPSLVINFWYGNEEQTSRFDLYPSFYACKTWG